MSAPLPPVPKGHSIGGLVVPPLFGNIYAAPQKDPADGLEPLAGGVGPQPPAPGVGRPFGAPRGGPETPPLIAARYGANNWPNLDGLVGAGNPSPGLGWRRLDIDRPCILWPCNVVTEALLYSPVKPTNFSGVGENENAIRSTGSGVCYLSGPGVWWVKYLGATTISFLLIDAQDPAVAARYLAEGGSNTNPRVAEVTVNAASTALIGANRNRKSIVIQNVSAAASSISLAFGTAAVASSGLELTAGSSITLSGDVLSRQAINAIQDGGAGPWLARVQEFT